jgi:hypothetical protein
MSHAHRILTSIAAVVAALAVAAPSAATAAWPAPPLALHTIAAKLVGHHSNSIQIAGGKAGIDPGGQG